MIEAIRSGEFIELTPEFQIVAIIREIQKKTEICIEVQDGRLTRVVCHGPSFIETGKHDPCLNSEGKYCLNPEERNLLELLKAIDYGSVFIIVEGGELIEIQDPVWSRKLRSGKIHHKRLGGFLRYMVGGSKDNNFRLSS